MHVRCGPKVVLMATVKWLPLWRRPDGESRVIFKYNVAQYCISEDNCLCLTLEVDDLAGLSISDLELANSLRNECKARQ